MSSTALDQTPVRQMFEGSETQAAWQMDSPELLLELLCGLGFSGGATVERYGVEMFTKRANTAGLEAVLHFVFEKHKGAKQAQKVSSSTRIMLPTLPRNTRSFPPLVRLQAPYNEQLPLQVLHQLWPVEPQTRKDFKDVRQLSTKQGERKPCNRATRVRLLFSCSLHLSQLVAACCAQVMLGFILSLAAVPRELKLDAQKLYSRATGRRSVLFMGSLLLERLLCCPDQQHSAQQPSAQTACFCFDCL